MHIELLPPEKKYTVYRALSLCAKIEQNDFDVQTEYSNRSGCLFISIDHKEESLLDMRPVFTTLIDIYKGEPEKEAAMFKALEVLA